MKNATHVANPVRVIAHQIVDIEVLQSELVKAVDVRVTLDNGTKTNISAEMRARYEPVIGDYLVEQEDGYLYVNPREVFERKYNAIGQKVVFQQDAETADFLRDVADRVTDTGENGDICTIVTGKIGGMLMVYTTKSALETLGVLRLGEKIMGKTLIPNETLHHL